MNGTKTTGSTSGAIANPQYSYITSSNPVTGYATWTDVLTLSYTPSSSTTKILIQVAGDANSSSSNSSEARIARKNSAGAFIQLGMKISVPNSSTKRMDQFIIDDLTVNTPESGGTQNYRIQIQASTSTNQASSTIGNASILISEILA